MELDGIRIREVGWERTGRVQLAATIALVTAGEVEIDGERAEVMLHPGQATIAGAPASIISVIVDEHRTRGFRALATIGGPVILPPASLCTIRARIQRELLARDEARLAALEGLALELIAECGRTYARQLDPLPPFVSRAAALIARSFAEPLTVAGLAERLDVQPSTLAERFRRHYGVTIGEYIRNCRIDFARRALAGAEATVADVARQAGFYDQSHFVRVFKRSTGETPISFRRAAHSVVSSADRRCSSASS